MYGRHTYKGCCRMNLTMLSSSDMWGSPACLLNNNLFVLPSSKFSRASKQP